MYSIVPKYLWQHQNWLQTPDLPEALFRKVRANDALERQLRGLVHAEDMERRMVEALAQEVVDNFAIENITLDSYAVRSSIVRECSLDIPEWDVRRVILLEKEQRAVEATLQALRHAQEKLSVDFMCGINRLLSPSRGMGSALDAKRYGEPRVSGIKVIEEGSGRQVFVGPEPAIVPQLLERFSEWWNEEKGTLPPAIHGAIGHLFFVIIHPFDDGNGRTARILAETALAGENSRESFRLYSLSNAIYRHKNSYYRLLEEITTPSRIPLFVDGMLDLQADAIRYATVYFTKKNVLKSVQEQFSGELSPFQKCLVEAVALDMSGKEWDIARIERMFPHADYEEIRREWNGIVEKRLVQKGFFSFEEDEEDSDLRPS